MNDVGSSIKSTATWWLWLGSGAIVIYVILMIIEEVLPFEQILLIGLGSALAVKVSATLIYGFGELVEQSIANRQNTDKILRILENQSIQGDAPVAKPIEQNPTPTNAHHAPVHTWRCAHCGKGRTQTPCEFCGKE